MERDTTTSSTYNDAPTFSPWPHFSEEELHATARVLRSGKVNYWTGEEVKQFEKEFSEYVGVRHAIATTNGTAALELALRSLGIGAGDEVIVPSRTFIASASCVVVCGAKPVIADVDPVSQNITAESINEVISSRTKAVIVVHLAGWPCEMEPILDVARKNGIRVIEDCAQAHGASYGGAQVGSLGDVAAFSFCQEKIMTTGGEGGMLLSDSEEIWSKAWSYKDHGKAYDAIHNMEHPAGFRWLHESFGTNMRMTELQAAIGRVQLSKLPYWVEKRRAYAAMLDDYFHSIDALRTNIPPLHVGHSYYKYYTFVRPELLSPEWDRDRIMNAVNNEGVPCSTGSCSEIYLEKAFVNENLGPAQRLPVARELGENSLMFQVHPTLTEADIEYTCKVVGDVVWHASTNRAAVT